MNVVLADLGIGNLHSLGKALEREGATVTTTDDAQAWLDASVLVLPGVGSFGAGLRAIEPVRDDLRKRLADDGVPCLGVCLGMQLLLEGSEEDPGDGVGLIRGRSVRFPSSAGKVPHMGWTRVHATHREDPLLAGIPEQTHFYFVHSYYPTLNEDGMVARATHGVTFPAILRKGNTVATQFHPEKSGTPGLRMIRNFLDEAEASR